MRKRSKKRIPQDERPWARIIHRDDEEINLFNKLASRSYNSNRRHAQTNTLSKQVPLDLSKICIDALHQDQQKIYFKNMKTETLKVMGHQHLLHKYYHCKFNNQNKSKNFCLFLGKNRTYNRKLFACRYTIRKLVKTGLIIGLQKK